MDDFSPPRSTICFLGIVVGLALTASCAPPAEMGPDAGVPDNALYPTEADPFEGEQNVLIDKVIRITYPNHIDSRTLDQSRVDLISGPINRWVRFYYDPLRTQLVVWPASPMLADATWILVLEQGILDIDGNMVAYGDILTFETGDEDGDNIPYVIPSFEDQVLPIFQNHCASCHSSSGGDAFAGLKLDSAEAIAETAMSEDSQSWSGWPRIAAYMPGFSYLLYKVIGDDRVAGMSMPRTPDLDAPADLIPMNEREILVDWIASGALFFDSEASQD